jgi:hypothetical protein
MEIEILHRQGHNLRAKASRNSGSSSAINAVGRGRQSITRHGPSPNRPASRHPSQADRAEKLQVA